MKTLLKNARLIDKKNNYHQDIRDILVVDGVINNIGKDLRYDDAKVIELNGYYISPGFIDMHVHCFPEDTAISMMPDEIGIKRGVTTLVDAGTAGADTIGRFYDNFISKSTTRVYSCLNIASSGLHKLVELRDLSAIEKDKIKDATIKYKDHIVALKARASATVVGENGITPIEMGKAIAVENNLPLVVHIGNAPPRVEDVINLLEEGDVVAHCFHNKDTRLIRDGKMLEEVYRAYNRGVKFDVAHGTSSFSIDIAREALSIEFLPHIISTDLYQVNEKEIVINLESTMNKFLYLGMPLEDIIERVTTNPASVMNLSDLGELKVGMKGDLTIFKLNPQEVTLIDSSKNKINVKNHIDTEFVFIKDKLIQTSKKLDLI